MKKKLALLLSVTCIAFFQIQPVTANYVDPIQLRLVQKTLQESLDIFSEIRFAQNKAHKRHLNQSACSVLERIVSIQPEYYLDSKGNVLGDALEYCAGKQNVSQRNAENWIKEEIAAINDFFDSRTEAK